jgi:hypothetical protein
MQFEEEESTVAQLLQRERCGKFATRAAESIRAADHCLFSLLPLEELSRLAADWHEACAQAMLRGNYALIDAWVRSQAQLAAAQGFAPDDLLQLLSICRQCAIQMERWSEDIFSPVEEVTREVFKSIRAEIPWTHAGALEDLEEDVSADAETGAKEEERTGERRRSSRNRLRFPIRVRNSGDHRRIDEITKTESVSRGGLYFVTGEKFQKDQILIIRFPYWNQPGSIDSEYLAKVVRIDPLPARNYGVGVDFIDSKDRRAY